MAAAPLCIQGTLWLVQIDGNSDKLGHLQQQNLYYKQLSPIVLSQLLLVVFENIEAFIFFLWACVKSFSRFVSPVSGALKTVHGSDSQT